MNAALKIEIPDNARGTDSVLVGCKLPHGLVMELIEPHPFERSMLPLPRDEENCVRINGAASMRVPKTNPSEHAYGLTWVPKTLADEWFKRNKDMLAVKDGSIFLAANPNQAKGEIKDRQGDVKTGLEPINPDGDSRLQHGVETNKEGGAIGNAGKAEPIFGRMS